MTPRRSMSSSPWAAAGPASSSAAHASSLIKEHMMVLLRISAACCSGARFARNGFAILIDHEFRIVAVPHGFNNTGRLLAAVIDDAAGGHRHHRALWKSLHRVEVVFRAPTEIPVTLQHYESTQLGMVMGFGRRP